MCGIAGIFCYDHSQHSTLDPETGLRMLDAIAHRGPDDGGLLVADQILLGHRRLSILDLSDAGHQPMGSGSGDDSPAWIAYNGEVYNFQDLRNELEQLGHHFHSGTDTEVILRGYLQWGHDVAAKLNGMFAIVIWDRRDRSLWMVRDSVGIKPLFFRDNGSQIWFGSEIKAILADRSVPRDPDWNGLNAFLTFGYTPAPATGFTGIQQLLPGEMLVAKDGRVTKTIWGELPYPDRPSQWSAQDCADELSTAIDQSVDRQMVSDVPLGALLSGGLDSSAVVRGMKRSGAKEIETFTIGFGESSFDESPYAQQVADIYQTDHHMDRVDADVIALLATLVSHAEEPFADNSMIPFYLLSESVRKRVTVALSGDGADELMGGYDTYRASELAPLYRMIPSPLRRALITPIVQRLPASTQKYGLTSLLRRFVAAAGETPPRDHCSWRRYVSADLQTTLFSDKFKQQISADPITQYASTVTSAPDWLTPFEQHLHVDLKFHLPNDMLVKVDRMSMAHSLEVRVPLLDQQVISACLKMPATERRQRKAGKLPLRAILRDDLPPDLVDRKKAGFLSPIEKWMTGPWQPLLRDFLDKEFASQTGMFNHKTLAKMIDQQASGRGDHAYSLFALFILAIWWRIWISEIDPVCPATVDAKPTRVHRLGSA